MFFLDTEMCHGPVMFYFIVCVFHRCFLVFLQYSVFPLSSVVLFLSLTGPFPASLHLYLIPLLVLCGYLFLLYCVFWCV